MLHPLHPTSSTVPPGTVLVTGAAGFIGSHVVGALLAAGHRVRGVDAFTDTYARWIKEANLADVRHGDGFELLDGGLLELDLPAALDGVSHVVHLAARPGVRTSWRDGFPAYVDDNVTATQRLLEACLATGVERVVYASSSSVYGQATTWPCREDAPTVPHSPYGVTKLAGEHLCRLYTSNHGLSTVSLRFFTVYGPRQRPDMAMHRLVSAALTGEPFPLYGDGSQVRDFTHVHDVVGAVLAAMAPSVPHGLVANVAGGSVASTADVIDLVGEVVGRPVPVVRAAEQAGDVRRTGGATEVAREVLGWTPTVDLRDGIAMQADVLRDRRASVA